MVEVPTPDKLMWPTLQAVKQLGGSGTNSEILATVVEREEFPEEIQNEPHVDGRKTRLDYNLAWAKTYLKKGGALNNSQRGVWSITDRGENLQEREMREIVREVRLDRRPSSQRTTVTSDVENEFTKRQANWMTKRQANWMKREIGSQSCYLPSSKWNRMLSNG